jgi:hypothetical protein
VIVSEATQPEDKVYVAVAVPELTPVTIPFVLIVKTEGVELDQVPPEGTPDKAVVPPT